MAKAEFELQLRTLYSQRVEPTDGAIVTVGAAERTGWTDGVGWIDVALAGAGAGLGDGVGTSPVAANARGAVLTRTARSRSAVGFLI